MKHLLTALMLVGASSVGLASEPAAPGGRTAVGLTAGYVTSSHGASAGLRFSYAFSRRFVLAPSVDYVFRHNGVDAFLINIDYHGPWKLDNSGHWYLYHILGINYGSWSRHVENPEGADDVSMRRGHVGLDFGAGVAWCVTPTLRLTIQGKYNWLSGNSTGLFNAGISYVF